MFTGIIEATGRVAAIEPRGDLTRLVLEAPDSIIEGIEVGDSIAVSGACLVMRRTVFNQVGGFDAEHLPVACNDIDLCLRVQEQGYRVLWTPHAELLYRHKASLGADDANVDEQARFQSEVEYMKRRWRQRLARDPFYNPNLSLRRGDFELAWPPRLTKPWTLDERYTR